MKGGTSNKQRDLSERIQTEGAVTAYETCLAICRDPKSPASAKQAAARTIMQAAGYLNATLDLSPAKEPHEMSAEELDAAVDRLERRYQLERHVRNEDENGIFE